MKECEGAQKAVQNSDLNACTFSFPGKEFFCKLMIHVHRQPMGPSGGQLSWHGVLPAVSCPLAHNTMLLMG